MTTQDAIDYFGTRQALADELGITGPAINQWGKFPPGLRQIQIEARTRGKLVCEPDVPGRPERPQRRRRGRAA